MGNVKLVDGAKGVGEVRLATPVQSTSAYGTHRLAFPRKCIAEEFLGSAAPGV